MRVECGNEPICLRKTSSVIHLLWRRGSFPVEMKALRLCKSLDNSPFLPVRGGQKVLFVFLRTIEGNWTSIVARQKVNKMVNIFHHLIENNASIAPSLLLFCVNAGGVANGG